MKEKITRVDRVFKILEILSRGDEVSLKQIEKEEGEENKSKSKTTKILTVMKSDYRFRDVDVCLKSLQNDMVYVKKYLGNNLVKKGSSYKLIKKESLNDFFKDNHAEIKKFFHAIALIDQSVFGENFKKYAPLLDAIKEEQKGVYLFLENPFENLNNLALKSQLERCIKDRRYIDINYYSNKEHIYKRVKAYKIIYQNGSWYLATITPNNHEINGGFKLLRLNFIKDIEYSTAPIKAPTNFNEEILVKDFLENKFQSLFTSFDKKFFIVRLQVDNRVARFFKAKKYLKSQKIIKETEDHIIVELRTNDEMEIIPLVQRWLPHVKVLEPKYIHEKILENIRQYS